MGKVVSLEELILHRRQLKGDGEKLVFVAGCFDLLHPGQIRLLEQARDCGDQLAVGVLSDASVAARYAVSATPASEAANESPYAVGVSRPITPASERSEILAALAMVDYVFEVDDSALPGALARLLPDTFVEAAVSVASPSAIRDSALRSGINIVGIPLEPGHSTAALIERITQLQA